MYLNRAKNNNITYISCKLKVRTSVVTLFHCWSKTHADMLCHRA